MTDVLLDLEQPDVDLDDALFEHDCPLHDDAGELEPRTLTVYDEKWLSLCCTEVAMAEEAGRRSSLRIVDGDPSPNDATFHRRQIRAAMDVAKKVRARMRRKLAGEPEPDAPDLADLWDR